MLAGGRKDPDIKICIYIYVYIVDIPIHAA